MQKRRNSDNSIKFKALADLSVRIIDQIIKNIVLISATVRSN